MSIAAATLPHQPEVFFFPKMADNPLARGLALRAQGFSVSAAAQEINVPRTTLRDELHAFDSIPLPEPVKGGLVTNDGQDFLKRIAIALHVCFRNACACGLRVLGQFLEMSGLDALLAPSLGGQWAFGRRIDEAIVQFGKEEWERMSPALKGRKVTLALDENFHEGPCAVAIEATSGFIVTESRMEKRDVEDWRQALAPALALLGVEVSQVTSDSGTAIVALCEQVLAAHHSPDFFHVLYDFSRSLFPILRRSRRRLEAQMEVSEREEDSLIRMQERWEILSPQERGRGRAPDLEKRIESEERQQQELLQKLALLSRRERALREALAALSKGYHPVCLDSGRRTGSATLRVLVESVVGAAKEALAEADASDGGDAIEKFLRMAEKMYKTLDHVGELWHGRSLALCPHARERYALEALLAPAAYLERIASTRTVLVAHELRKTALALRLEATQAVGEARVDALAPAAREMAQDFQRSSSMVEGRNGVLSLRHHAFHELSPLKREVLTTLHNFVVTRQDGTTASQRLSGIESRSLIDWLCNRIDVAPRPGGKRQVGNVP